MTARASQSIRLALVALAVSVPLAGCGSDTNAPAVRASAPPPSATTATTGTVVHRPPKAVTTPATTGASRTATATPPPPPPLVAPRRPKPSPRQVATAVAACSSYLATKGLSASARRRIQSICRRTGEAGVRDVNKLATDACVAAARDTTKKGSAEEASRLENCNLQLRAR